MKKITIQPPSPPPLPVQAPLQIDVTKTHLVSDYLTNKVPLTCARIDPTGKYSVAGAMDFDIRRWELNGESKKELLLKGHQSWVRSLDFSLDGTVLFSGAYDEQVGLWNIQDTEPKPLHLFKAHNGWVRWVRVSPNGKLLASCGNDNLVKVWELNGSSQPKLVHTFKGHERYVHCLEFHPDGRRLVSFDLMGVLHEWDLQTGKMLRTLEAKVMWGYDKKFAADQGGARDMRFNSDGTLLAVAGLSKVTNAFAGVHQAMVLLIDWKTGKPKQELHDEKTKGICWGVRFHPAGFIMAAVSPQAGRNGSIWFFKPDQTTKKPFHTVKLSGVARSVDLTPDGKQFAVAQNDNKMSLYQMTEKR